MARLRTLWRCLLDACSGLCDKFRSQACKPVSEPICEDLLMEIFSRLPAECVHQCRLAYTDWDTLFSTFYFKYDLFLPRASPTIMVHRGSVDDHELFSVDDDHQGGLKCTQVSLKHPFHDSWLPMDQYARVRFSCYGLLFLDVQYLGTKFSRIVNPITWGWLPIPHDSDVQGDICGAYFHPTARVLNIIWVSIWITSNKIKQVEYKLLRPIRLVRPIRFGEHRKFHWNALSKLEYRPMPGDPPVNLHECLHWMCYKYGPDKNYIQLIMVFSIIKEEFKLMPLIPGAQPSQDKLKLLHLFDLDGCLSLWQLTDVLNIWTVDDYSASWSWRKRYNIEVNLLHEGVNIDEVSVVGCQNGALVIHWRGKGIFVYHLQLKNTKKFLFSELEGDLYHNFTTPFLHTKALL